MEGIRKVRLRKNSVEKTMMVKEVAEVLGVTDKTVRNYVDKLGKDLTPVKNTQGGYLLTEKDVTLIKLRMEKNQHLEHAVELPKTDLEKELIIQQAIIFQQEKIMSLHILVQEQEKELFHKTEVITGLTDNITILEKRKIINRIAKRGDQISNRYQALYKVFLEDYSIDLPVRSRSYNSQQSMKKNHLSVIAYAEKFGHINDLYSVTCKLFESDLKDVLKQLNLVINDNQAWKSRSYNEDLLIENNLYD